MPRGLSADLSAVVLIALAVVATGVAYWKDPGLPLLGAKGGLSVSVPRVVPSLAFPVIAGGLVKLYYHG
jgi:hypothetical protein